MANEYYVPGEQRAEKVEDLFAGIAPRYDLINDLQSFGLHRRWKRRLVELAQVKPSDAALDLCCGTGDVSFALAAAGAIVTGLDFSGPMLEVAQARSSKFETVTPHSALRTPHFIQGDALKTPFADASFDIVSISYGLRNLADFDAGLREMWRVARPNARLLVLDFGKPDNAFWRAFYLGYLRFGVPVFGRLFCKNAPAYAYIYESLMHYPAQRGVDAKLRELGCFNTRIVNFLGGAMSINVGEKP
ncbi:MAG: ubiquinone/menaquinone biosynthesis methyltransferase [Verrucomicrobia bacterium]|nr:ubiquinone/menaquinone biosynthesis methyltransferase [Verrucomicrobiota bacterium]